MNKLIILALLINSLFILFPQNAYAANTTMSVSPQSGTFGKEFTASVVLDGRGERFNAASAKVGLSKNLTITSLTFGDCNFSFLNTPTKEIPSFEGIILSSYATKCTVYTLKVAPTATGKGTITFSDASVKQYGDAKDILASTKNATYNLTGSVAKSALGSTEIAKSQKGLYSVLITVLSADEPGVDASVTLNTAEKKYLQNGKTNDKGEVQFTNLKEGIYDVVVEKDGKKVGETIINLSGQNYLLSFNMNLETQKDNPLMKEKNSVLSNIMASPMLLIAVLAIGLGLGIGGSFILFRMKKK